MEWLRKGLVGLALAAGAVASVATSPATEGLEQAPPSVMGETQSDGFQLSAAETVRTGTVHYETIGAVAARLTVSLELEQADEDVELEMVVVHGIHAETAEMLQARLEAGSGAVSVDGVVTLECDATRDTCVHDEPFLIRINRVDDGEGDVTARLRVGGSLELQDLAGPSAEDAVVVEIDATR